MVDEDHSKKQNVVILKLNLGKKMLPGFALNILGSSLVGRPLKSQLEAYQLSYCLVLRCGCLIIK